MDPRGRHMHGQPLAHQNRGPGEVEITNDMDNQCYNRTIKLCDGGDEVVHVNISATEKW